MKTRDLDTLLENEYPYEPPVRVIEMTHHNTHPIMTKEAERFNAVSYTHLTLPTSDLV